MKSRLALLLCLLAAPAFAAGTYPVYGINFYGAGAENSIKNGKGMYSLEMIYTRAYTNPAGERARLQNIVNAGFKVILRLDYDVGYTVPPNWDWNGRYDFAMKSRQIAQDLGDLVEVFVIGNEPLVNPSTAPTAQWYSYIFNAYDSNCVYDKIKEVRPAAKVALAAPGGWPGADMQSFFDSVLATVDKDASGLPQIDAFALHAYSGASTSSDTTTEDPRYADVNDFGVFRIYARKIYEKFGTAVKPIYITETNTYWYFGAWATNPRNSDVSYRADWMKEAYQAIDEWNKSNDQKIDALLWYVYQHCGQGCSDQYENSLVRTDNALLNRARQDFAWVTANTHITPGFAGSTLRFQAENYSNSDTGNGMGVTNGVSGTDYADSDAGNTGGAYRKENVDIAVLPDWSGFFVGWTAPGEWLRYETLSGGYTYKLRFRYARGASGTSAVRLLVDGVARGGTVSLTGTPNASGQYDWNTYRTQDGTTTFTLPKGFHELKLVFDTGSVNIDWFELVRV
ncbi:carbohydrate binding protein with CBM6 domain [Archangium gephyra]|uniref:Carbohydrate binding protein with CBM6 domain n=1 Tax=Archangium gephyra TaxID=48 RepID=A0AAC8Q1P5_9BACT|nr:carbohydrate-binding protein [Archangium gephyra]AKI98673.1 Hypothetical protein AA314_00300 [Archangium gephyra]REG30601.1 carbohydrate binding protein with CBM6 domain [Archangium gephyra]